MKILLINKQEVPSCQCSQGSTEHWSVQDLMRVVGRPLTPADSIEIKGETTDD